jgi:putative membrane protein
MMWPYHMGYVGWGGMLLGGIFMLLFWGAIIFVAVLAIRAFSRSNQSAGRNDNYMPQGRDSLEILKERYARGEITREQYQEIKRDLET